MELEESVIESTFAFSRFASLMLVLATIVFFILGHFFGVESEKIDLNQAKEQARIAENIQKIKLTMCLRILINFIRRMK